MPDDTRLEVEATLANRDVGFVHAGQRVEMKVEAFEFTRYGLLHGTVTGLSRDIVSEDDRQSSPRGSDRSAPAQDATESSPRDPVYLAHVAVQESGIETEQGFAQVAPGMAVTAEIKTGRRRVISSLLSPLARHAHESGKGEIVLVFVGTNKALSPRRHGRRVKPLLFFRSAVTATCLATAWTHAWGRELTYEELVLEKLLNEIHIQLFSKPGSFPENGLYLESIFFVAEGSVFSQVEVQEGPDCSIKQATVLQHVPPTGGDTQIALVTAQRQESDRPEIPVQTEPRPQLLRLYEAESNETGQPGKSRIWMKLVREKLLRDALRETENVRRVMLEFANSP